MELPDPAAGDQDRSPRRTFPLDLASVIAPQNGRVARSTTMGKKVKSLRWEGDRVRVSLIMETLFKAHISSSPTMCGLH
jgi:hypothetical protein